jgi:hypothetical protein
VIGGGLPPRGGCPHPRRQEPQRRQRSRRPWRARKHPPPGVRGRTDARHEGTGTCLGGVWGCCGSGDRRHNSVRRTLEEE